MATRAKLCDVQKLLGSSAPSDEKDLLIFVETANRMVNMCYSGSGIDEGTLKSLETWLAAHLAFMANPDVLSSSKLGDAADTYQRSSGTGLQSSSYGQQAMLFDVNGCIQNLGKKRITWEVL